MKINGKEKKLEEPMTILALLRSYKLSRHVVVIHVNGEIVPTELYGTIILEDTDEVRLTSIVGGG